MWFNTPPVASPADLSQSEGDALLLRHLHQITKDPADLGDLAPYNLPERNGEEYRRLLQVSCRLEELLYEKGQLQNLDYSDEDIDSLRKQLIDLSPSSEAQNGSQKRKLSASESPSVKPKACKRLRSDTVMDEIPSCLKHHYKAPKVKAAVLEELEGVIQFRVVNNDNSPMNMIILTGLKNIFQKQLPKMPREYIARLIYDRNHLSMAIVRGIDTGKIEVMGGITYRPFNHRRFAEIVFCAIASNEQVRGYGAHLMNHLKDYVKASSPIIHFLTYADNYAIGYFKKQGFTKDINLDRQIWVGYIKDYEGGTIMQCTMLPEIRYLNSSEILARQKAAILYKIAATSQDAKVYPGLAAFKQGTVMDPAQIPGLRETGWSKESDDLARQPRRPGHYHVLQTLLSELQNHPSAWPFVQAVNRDEVPDYYEVIKEPMDLTTMEFKLDNDQYESVAQFIYDAKLVFNNCRAYNNETTTYYKNASRLEKSLTELIQSKFVEYSGLL